MTNGKPLALLAYAIIESYGLLEKLKIDVTKLKRFSYKPMHASMCTRKYAFRTCRHADSVLFSLMYLQFENVHDADTGPTKVFQLTFTILPSLYRALYQHRYLLSFEATYNTYVLVPTSEILTTGCVSLAKTLART